MIKLIYQYGDLMVVKYSKPDTKSDQPFYVISIADINIKVEQPKIEEMVRAINSENTISMWLEYGRKPGEYSPG